MKIGIFDSGYGGLTILDKIRSLLPQYDYLYLGDNARTPYGTRSFEIVYQYTLQCVEHLFGMGCQLVILACNTASAKALRSIQRNDLPGMKPSGLRVLGVIRPTVESVGSMTASRVVGLLATDGTIQSESYPLEIKKIYPDIQVVGQPCPIWVPLIETGEHLSSGADYFVEKYVSGLFRRDSRIDTVILGCTHYPLLIDKIKKYMPENVRIVVQGDIVAESLKDYLHRHPEIETLCSKGGTVHFYTTESVEKFRSSASIFLNMPVTVEHIPI